MAPLVPPALESNRSTHRRPRGIVTDACNSFVSSRTRPMKTWLPVPSRAEEDEDHAGTFKSHATFASTNPRANVPCLNGSSHIHVVSFQKSNINVLFAAKSVG